MCAVVLPVSPLPRNPSSSSATLLPDFDIRYAVVTPAIPPPTIATSTEIFSDNFLNLTGWIVSLNQDDSLCPDVCSSQLSNFISGFAFTVCLDVISLTSDMT